MGSITISGCVTDVSHLDIVCILTFKRFASCCCVTPLFSRNFFIIAPIFMLITPCVKLYYGMIVTQLILFFYVTNREWIRH